MSPFDRSSYTCPCGSQAIHANGIDLSSSRAVSPCFASSRVPDADRWKAQIYLVIRLGSGGSARTLSDGYACEPVVAHSAFQRGLLAHRMGKPKPPRLTNDHSLKSRSRRMPRGCPSPPLFRANGPAHGRLPQGRGSKGIVGYRGNTECR
jgi:hypothetical protein